jgi:hypothetical protein
VALSGLAKPFASLVPLVGRHLLVTVRLGTGALLVLRIVRRTRLLLLLLLLRRGVLRLLVGMTPFFSVHAVLVTADAAV